MKKGFYLETVWLCEEFVGGVLGVDDGVGWNFTFYDFSFEKGRFIVDPINETMC